MQAVRAEIAKLQAEAEEVRRQTQLFDLVLHPSKVFKSGGQEASFN